MAKAMVQKEEATAILRKAMAMVNRQVAMAKVMEKVMELVVIATGMGEDMETPMATGEDMMDMEMGMEQKDMDMDMATEKLAATATATAMSMATGKCQVQCSLEQHADAKVVLNQETPAQQPKTGATFHPKMPVQILSWVSAKATIHAHTGLKQHASHHLECHLTSTVVNLQCKPSQTVCRHCNLMT